MAVKAESVAKTAIPNKQSGNTSSGKPVLERVDLEKIVKKQGAEQQMIEVSREQWIAEAAYYWAEKHNFEPKFDEENWLKAEEEYEAVINL